MELTARERLLPDRLFKTADQQGRSKRKVEAYSMLVR